MKSFTAALCLYALQAGVLYANPTPVELSSTDRTLFAESLVVGREQVPMIFATAPERTAHIAGDLQRRGAQVIGRRDSVGYLYALVPTQAVESLVDIQGLQALQLAATHMRGLMSPDDGATLKPARNKGSRGTPPSPSTPLDNPYTGESATQALQFKAAQPTFDGRGVVTAFVEPAAPNMSTMKGALDISGKPLPKFAGYDLGSQTTAAAPIADGDTVWQQTEAVTPDAQGQFKWQEGVYHLPAGIKPSSTRWRICRRLSGGFFMLKDRYDFLWAVDRQQVWALPASAAMEFSEAPSVSLKEAMPWIAVGDAVSRRSNQLAAHAFVFAADAKKLWLGTAVTHAGHAGMVGGVMAGSGFLGGKVNGIAPAAQVMIYHGGFSGDAPGYAGIQQMLAMVTDPKVDLAQASYSIGDTSGFGGISPQQIWMDRILRKNGKPFVKAPGNFGAHLYANDEFSNSDEVFSVGGYTPRETWLANLGIETGREHTVASYTGWGPADDGALKPDFLGMTHTLTEGLGGQWYWEAMPGYEQYAVSGGTSAGAPNGAGHLALLISAAKQTGVPYDVKRLRAAVATTAKFLDGVPARAQGHGLVQVSDAWSALQRAVKWQPVTLSVQAPLVGAEAGPEGPVRTIGRGLFELSGWHPGQRGRRELTVTRTAGGTKTGSYRLRWKGDVNVFSSPQQTIELPLGKPVRISIDIQVGAQTASHSAILDLVDSQADLVVGSILCTVMVSDPLPANGLALKYTRAAQRLGNTLFFVDVPTGLSAITVNVSKDESSSYWYAQDPAGRQMPFNRYGSETYKAPEPASMKARKRSITYVNPVPGVWQFCLQLGEPRSMEDLDAVEDWSKPMPLEVEVRGWTAADDSLPLSASTDQIAAMGFANSADSRDVEIKAVGVGATRTAEVKLTRGLKPVFFDIVVDPGATKLEVQLQHAVSGARVGLYVYKIPEGERLAKSLNAVSDETALVYYDSSFTANKRYALAGPMAGRYRIALDPVHLPAGEANVSYRDTVYHPVYGSVEVTAAGNPLASQAKVNVRARPEPGRRWMAQVGLFGKQNPEEATAIATRSWTVSDRPGQSPSELPPLTNDVYPVMNCARVGEERNGVSDLGWIRGVAPGFTHRGSRHAFRADK